MINLKSNVVQRSLRLDRIVEFFRALTGPAKRTRFPIGTESDRRLALEFDLAGIAWGENPELKQTLLRRMERVGGLVLLNELVLVGGRQTRRMMGELRALGFVRLLWRPFWIKREGYKLTHYGWQLAKVLHIHNMEQIRKSTAALDSGTSDASFLQGRSD